jgi:toxin ParE1/3/4
MIPAVNFLHAAEIEAADAIDWYEDKQTGLGAEFRSTIEKGIIAIQYNPFAFPVVYGTAVRRLLHSGSVIQ